MRSTPTRPDCSRHRSKVLAAVALLGALSLPLARADEEPAATPYRPTASNPAELSAPGWLELEAGAARTKVGGAQWQNNAPWLLKLAFTEDFGIMLGGDLHIRQTDAGTRRQGGGDTSLAFKHRWEIDESAALGLEWGSKFATAANGLGSGKQDYGVNGIYSQDIGKYRVDTNVGVTQLGLVEAGLARRQYQWASAVSRPLGEDWTLALEVSGVYRQGAASSNQLLAAAAYNVSKRLVVDFGMTSGLSDAAPRWSAFFGLTYLAGKLW